MKKNYQTTTRRAGTSGRTTPKKATADPHRTKYETAGLGCIDGSLRAGGPARVALAAHTTRSSSPNAAASVSPGSASTPSS